MLCDDISPGIKRNRLSTTFIPFATFQPFETVPMPGSGPTKFELEHATGTAIKSLADGIAGKFAIDVRGFYAANLPPTPGCIALWTVCIGCNHIHARGRKIQHKRESGSVTRVWVVNW